jgi:hypothetical protein
MLIPPELDEPVFSDKRWMVRVVTGEPMYFYVDGPFDGVDDGLIESFFNWDLYSDSVIYLFGDYAGLPTKLHNKTVIKQSSHKNDTSIACFYGTMIDITPKLIMDCKLVASFQGSLKTHPIRQKVYEAIQPFGSFHYETTPFWASTPPEEKLELRRRYLENLNDSQFILCPRGVGLNSIRFFEALRMGRIPVLIAANHSPGEDPGQGLQPHGSPFRRVYQFGTEPSASTDDADLQRHVREWKNVLRHL